MFSYDPTQAIRGECLTYGTAKAIYGQYPAHSALNYDILTLQDVPRVFGLSRKFSIRFWTFWITGN
ncbi:MAG: hypothetical protein NTW71_13645 [Deltaproteobacteria bacterium]|nr:hypothetical protein [Deltaproteobacteria bacterium]